MVNKYVIKALEKAYGVDANIEIEGKLLNIKELKTKMVISRLDTAVARHGLKIIDPSIIPGLIAKLGDCPCIVKPTTCPCFSAMQVVKGTIETCHCGLFGRA